MPMISAMKRKGKTRKEEEKVKRDLPRKWRRNSKS